MVYRTVSSEGWVSYRQNAYSVPWQHVGRVLPVRITEDVIYLVEGDIVRHKPVALV